MIRSAALLGCLLGSLLLARFLPAQEAGELISLHLWCELEPLDWQGEGPLGGEQAARRLLEEARQVFSAMIYGYRFFYVPADAARGVAEQFRLDPIGEIAWGDPRLQILQTEEREARLYARLDYRLDAAQLARRSAWASNTIPQASGSGEGSVFRGPAEKRAALQAALREAVRNHLRPRLFNKPREVLGEILLWNEPRTIVRSGAYLTTVAAKVRLTRIEPYRIF